MAPVSARSDKHTYPVCLCRWRKLSSSCLNEATEDDAQAKDDGKSYTPQYNVTGQRINYRVEKGDQEHGSDI
jgi:hypothetical protein